MVLRNADHTDGRKKKGRPGKISQVPGIRDPAKIVCISMA